jgi:para-nitrobenzyl esterase
MGRYALLLGMLLPPHLLRAQLRSVEQRTAHGVLQGVESADGKVRTFKGIPYAAPPVGPLRWKAPQPAAAWTGARQATEYGARCMQAPIYSDMIFHDAGPSEDCLYLNLWMPAAPARGDEEELRFEEEAAPAVLELGLHRDGVMPMGPADG